MSRTREIVKDSIFYSISNYVSFFFKAITSVVIRKFLSVTNMGLLSELILVNEYGKSHHLGVLNALDREIPYCRGKGDAEKIKKIETTAFNFSILSATFVTVVLFITALIVGAVKKNAEYGFGLVLVAVLLLAELAVSYYRIILRCNNRFGFLSKFNIGFAAVETILTFLLVIIYGFKGVLAALILTSLILTYFLVKYGGYKPAWGWRIDPGELVRLFKIGFPLYLYDLVRTLFLTVDRLIIVFFLGRTSLGLYSIAMMAYNFLAPLPRGVYNVIFPKFYEAYGKNDSIEHVKGFLVKPTMIFAYLFALVVGLAAAVFPPFIRHVLPNYTQGVTAAIMLIVSAFFYSLIFMWGYFLIALYKQIKMVQFNLLAVAANLVLSVCFVKFFGMGINGVALGTVISHFLLSLGLISYVFAHYTRDAREHLLFFFKLYLPIIWIAVILAVFRFFYNYRYVSLKGDIAHALVLCLLMIAAYLPFLFYINRKTLILNHLWQAAAGFIRKR